jgi:uncharacterized hydrophobic protein (TIGR00271 family)
MGTHKKQKTLSAQTSAIIEHGAMLDADYIVLLLGAACIALGAIFTDSIPVLIASMVIAPLSSPILLIGLGLARCNWRQIGKGVWTLAVSVVAVLLISVVVTILLQQDRVPDILISFNGNQGIALGIAIVAGIVAAYGTTKPRVAAVSTGVAIAVSLMPPLVATGVGLAPGGTPFEGALMLFLLNIIGIAVSSAVTFTLLGVGRRARGNRSGKG